MSQRHRNESWEFLKISNSFNEFGDKAKLRYLDWTMASYNKFQNLINSSLSNGNKVVETEGPYLRQCREVDTWFMMNSPWTVLTVVALYLCFVTKLGPEFMKDKKPFNVKSIILVYNLCQMLYNTFIVSQLSIDGAYYLYIHGCHPMDQNLNPYVGVLNVASWHYFISKLMDLSDTIFFVLRKKNSHITFLHVYHHANMVLTSWIYLKYIKGEQGAIVGWLNSAVHTVMYSYYFLSALGPSIKKYLWWKKYITWMQMIQFILIIVYMLTLLIGRCDLSHSFTCFVIIQGVIFLALFVNFYVKVYVQKTRWTVDQNQRIETDRKSQ